MNFFEKWAPRVLYAALLSVMTASVYFTGSFGFNIPQGTASGLALAAFAGSCTLLAPFFGLAFTSNLLGRKWMWGFAFLLAIAMDFTGNFAFVAAEKEFANQTAAVQTARFDGAQESVTDSKQLRAKLEADREALRLNAMFKAGAASASFDGLIAAAEEAVKQEANNGGCGPKCLAKKETLASLTAQQEYARRDEELATQLAALDRVLDGRRTVAAKTDLGFSVADVQSKVLARSALLNEDVGGFELFATGVLLSLLMAIGISAVPTIALQMIAPNFLVDVMQGVVRQSPAVRRETATDTAVADLRSTSAAMSALMPDKAIQQLREVRAICA